VLDLVREIGAAAAFAEVAGLALLSTLHVSQARELKRLRQWAGRATERSATAAPRRIGARGVALVFAGLLVLGGAAYGVSRLTGGAGSRANIDHRVAAKPKRTRAAVKPADVTVAVLNGTTVPGLAAALREQIAAAGFIKGAINDFSDKQLAESVVEYAPGHEAEAKAVGRTIGITRHEPVTADGRALGGDATVIVIAGADKAP
jgi:LytR cell envelope-related transcriptional attenuator